MKKPPPISTNVISNGMRVGKGKYKLIKRLAVGGNGEVWLADHLSIGQPVVVKFPRGKEGIQLSQLVAEIQHLSFFSNRHPNIVNVLDAGLFGTGVFVVVQYLANGSLRKYLWGKPIDEHFGGRSIHRRGDWLRSIASALDFLHANGLFHCDVKPDNILFDSSCAAYLGDFGIAVSTSTPSTDLRDRKLHGSLPYMAPELFQSGIPNARTDLFSLAATTWEFLTGQRCVAIESQRDNSIENSVRGLHFSELRPDTDSNLDPVFQQALSAIPCERFESCSAFAEAVIRHWPFDEQAWRRASERSGTPKHGESGVSESTNSNAEYQLATPTLSSSDGNSTVDNVLAQNCNRSVKYEKKKISLRRLLPSEDSNQEGQKD
ncbi:MAG TPA: serine/threonine-protein kinase [Pirellulaceae bacterium]|nr:serine/threonine-protein kinase [Pirellulaceae bacterium]HMO92867.1 serine/threonine-protein kinase [Pirellulaceae bacterium]HMP71100.1 serine/threonine-protein kinase [Pirellulaceae bacterium]